MEITHVFGNFACQRCAGFIIPYTNNTTPDSKVHGANMGPIWGRKDPGGPHVGPMNFAIWDVSGKAY